MSDDKNTGQPNTPYYGAPTTFDMPTRGASAPLPPDLTPSPAPTGVLPDSAHFSPASAGPDDGLRSDAALLAERSHLEHDPAYIGDVENYSAMEHADLVAHVQAIDTGVIGALGDAYKQLSADLDIAWDVLALRRILGDGSWTGDAASAAESALATFGSEVSRLNDALNGVGLKLDYAESTASATKIAMPPVPEVVGHPLPLDASTYAARQKQAEGARLEAVRIMTTLYAPGYVSSGSSVPSMPRPSEIAGPGSGGGGGMGSPGGFGGGSGGFSNGTGQHSASSTPTDAMPAADDAASTQAASADGAPAGTQPASAGGTAPGAATTSAASSPYAYGATPSGTSNGTGTSNAQGAGIYGGGGHGSGGGGGFVGGAAGGGGARRSNEREAPSAASGAIPGAAAGAAAAAGANMAKSGMGLGRPGTGMAPMMAAAPGARANGAEDTEHETPSYLVTVENGNELVGEIAPVAPPVLGA
ncbi:hypothetical protein [Rhodococcus rhodnii]|uniref:PPE family domain-containing protein n=1 Tax=Rhodococcus rhodnii LMG 5362 TaxID=1273125 RepID=R7WPN5_9NOCA|nr:hypothetical protein [Rhodococcus rhodnii]EOM77268.1 hypothetical protein Rrhod_1371 [Rhodococcus rhodnii LMG 5362]